MIFIFPAALTFWIVLPDGSLTYNYHGEGVEASPGEEVSQIGDGGEGRHVGSKAALPLQLGQLQGAAQLVQGVPSKHGPDEHPVRLQHLVDLQTHSQGCDTWFVAKTTDFVS